MYLTFFIHNDIFKKFVKPEIDVDTLILAKIFFLI